MTPTSSPRLGLVVDTLNETDINTNHPNWDRVDYASGFTNTTKAVGVPLASQFDGQLVAETDTGNTWFVTPGDTKRRLNYPYFASLKAAWPTGYTNNVQQDTGYQSIESGSINTTAADLDAATGGWVVPIKGIYEVGGTCRWATGASGTRRHGFTMNGSQQTAWERIENGVSNIYTTTNMFKELVILDVGNLVRPYVFQNSGAALTAELYLRAKLIRPLI